MHVSREGANIVTNHLISRNIHWEKVYLEKVPGAFSWYRPHLQQSLRFLHRAGLSPASSLIDVGGGASTLVDDLLELGCLHITVLDISSRALEISKERLGARAEAATWITGDITSLALPTKDFDFWHDRAVFHFLTSPEDRRKYVSAIRASLRPGGHAVMATFATDGPPRCSGLEVCRYDATSLCAELGPGFHLMESVMEQHRTPTNATQSFLYCLFRYNGT
jgi:ubiquinone/menaquinone biosynthesis C-methylase UbiE